MAELKVLCIHCADTNPNFQLTKEDLEQWHMGPKDVKDKNGKLIEVRYKGIAYPSRDALPYEFIGLKSIKTLYGRGWDRLGYSDLIHRNGLIENLTPYNSDDWITPEEMTWGATGWNSNGRHAVLEGGRTVDNESKVCPFFELFTDAQFTMLTAYINQFIKDHPGDKIMGHYMVSGKPCPNFLLPGFFADAGISLEHLFKP